MELYFYEFYYKLYCTIADFFVQPLIFLLILNVIVYSGSPLAIFQFMKEITKKIVWNYTFYISSDAVFDYCVHAHIRDEKQHIR